VVSESRVGVYGTLSYPCLFPRPVSRRLLDIVGDGYIHVRARDMLLLLEDRIPLDIDFCWERGCYPTYLERLQTFVRVFWNGQTLYANRVYFNRDSIWCRQI